MTKQDFRKHITFAFIIQAVLVGFTLLAPVAYCLGLIILQSYLIITWRVFNIDHYWLRLKQVYPDHQINFRVLKLAMLFPVLFFGITLLLCVKDDAKDSFLRFLRLSYLVPFLFVLITIQVAIPHLAYWSAPPTVSVLNLYGNPHPLYIVNVASQIAVYSRDVSNQQKRSIASGMSKEEAEFHYVGRMLEKTYQSLTSNESRKFSFFDFGPFQWFSPMGLLEILWSQYCFRDTEKEFKQLLLAKSLSVLNSLQNKLDKANEEMKAKYGPGLKDLEMKLKNTEPFRTPSHEASFPLSNFFT